MDTFTKIEQGFEEEGSGGISGELRQEALKKRETALLKLSVGGCKSMEAYADCVGFIRGLDFFLDYAAIKAEKVRKELAAEQEES